MVHKSQFANLGLFDAKVPRYTSYPTAPHFNTDVGPGVFADWVAQIPARSSISLYVHVPFCRRLCWFCACRTQGTQSDKPVAAYVETLKAELALLARHLPKDVTLTRLHWGGGTPTLLSPAMMEDLAGSIAEIAPLAPNSEFSVEIDPNEIDEPRLDVLARAGMNRASIGVQDFDCEIQQAIGRIQSYEITRDAVDMIRARRVASLNTDILFGLPHQNQARMTETVQKLLSLSPDRVALYGYAHVPWMAKRQQLIPPDALPRPQERMELFETARELLLWDHYTEIGIDHFATKEDRLSRAQTLGKLRRNFQGYTDDPAQVLIGVGASSISKFPQGFAQNTAATSAYTSKIRGGRFSTARGHIFNGQDRMRARMIESVMCDFSIDLDEICRDFGADPVQVIQMFRSAENAFPGCVHVTDDALFVPPTARPLARLIARNFDAYDLCKTGHSTAI